MDLMHELDSEQVDVVVVVAMVDVDVVDGLHDAHFVHKLPSFVIDSFKYDKSRRKEDIKCKQNRCRFYLNNFLKLLFSKKTKTNCKKFYESYRTQKHKR